MRAIATLLVLALVLSGCAGSSDNGSSTSGSSTTQGSSTSGSKTTGPTTTGATGSGTTSGGPGPAGNHAPIPQLGASAEAGPAPFGVNFTVDATDEDKDPLTWTLAFGDGSTSATGASVPATVAHNFTSLGNYTVILTVSDGKTSASATLNLTVSGGATQDETADYTGNPAECFLTVLGDLEGISHVRIDINPATYGAPFVATWDTTSPPAWVEIGFWNDDGLLYRYGGWGNDIGAPAASPGQTEQTGTVVDASTYATLRACDGGPGSITYHAG